MMYNPFKAHIRTGGGGKFRIAKLGLLGWAYLDVQEHYINWWPVIFRPLDRWLDIESLDVAQAKLAWYTKKSTKFKRVL